MALLDSIQKKWIWPLVAATLIYGGQSVADECGAVLAKDVSSFSTDNIQEYSFYRFVDTEEEFKAAKSGSASGSYKLVSASADFDEYMQRRNSFLSRTQISMSSDHSERVVTSIAPAGAIAAWRDCQLRSGQALLVYFEDISEEAATLVVFRDPGSDTVPVSLEGVQASEGISVPRLRTELGETWPSSERSRRVILPRSLGKELRVAINIGSMSDSARIPGIPEEPPLTRPGFVISTVSDKSAESSRPRASACLGEGYKLIGGGANIEYRGSGVLLTSSYPQGNCWVVEGKDHLVGSLGTATAYAIGLYDPGNEWEVRLLSQGGQRKNHPDATVSLPNGFALTSCGGKIDWRGAGNLLTAIYPSGNNCVVKGKDHGTADPASATAFVIGIRPANGTQPPRTVTLSAESGSRAHPMAEASLPEGYQIVGGGAEVSWFGAGNLLTSTFPRGATWTAKSKDHEYSSPATIRAYVIGVEN